MSGNRKRRVGSIDISDADPQPKQQRASYAFSFASPDSIYHSGAFTSNENLYFGRGLSLEQLSCGVFESAGKQQRMEDRHVVVPFTPIQVS